LAGLISLEGSGRYLSDKKTSAKTVKSSLLYSIKTKEESLNIFYKDLKSAFALNAIKSELATHVVVGITWGADTILTSEYQNTDNRDVKEVEGVLSAELEKLSVKIKGRGEVGYQTNEKDNELQFKIRMYGNILPGSDPLPTNFEDALALMKKMPEYVRMSNGGKGMPLTYSLIPISVLKDYLKFSFKSENLIQLIAEESLLRVVHLFEKFSEASQVVHDFYQTTQAHKFCMETNEIENIRKLKAKLELSETKFRSSLALTLKDVRNGEKEMSALETLLAEFQLIPDRVKNQIEDLNHISEKISFANLLISNGVTYVGHNVTLDVEIQKKSDKTAYVLYFKNISRNSSSEIWNKNRQIFFQELEKKNVDHTFFVVDCDIHQNMWPQDELSIQVLKNGQVVSYNLVCQNESESRTPYAKCNIPMTQTTSKPNKRSKLSMPCPGKNCHQKDDFDWICPNCNVNVEYGFDQKCYCSCGYGAAENFEFKCPGKQHGIGYEAPSAKYLQELLCKLRPFKELNILILGETGVGKSTWINGFYNYLTYSSLKEAEENDLCSIIPTKFIVCDENFEEISVSTGEDTNEVQSTGQSATQQSKVYSFCLDDDTTVRLIDTPGIGDTSGIEQDKKNFNNILSTLSGHEELHGICILLKPNNARLSVVFKYCIKELLTYLHCDASKNIIFCFTNSRGTFYRPGDTLPVLKTLLKSNLDVEIPVSQTTVYCFDSEAFRFLAAIKNKSHPVKFPDEERENFAKSWERSCYETWRMMKHIKSLTPHPIQSTINLNFARELVQKLTRPMAKITQNIQSNKGVLQDEIKEIEQTKANINDLEKRKLVKKIDLEIIKIDYPKTVCTDSKCSEVYGGGDYKKIKYTSNCHGHCYLTGVSHDTIGDAQLMNCLCMSNGTCNRRNCGHSYRVHMHVYYDTREVDTEVEDKDITDLLKSKLSAAEIKQKIIYGKHQLIEELNNELKIIQEASIKFAMFLKRYAITVYNDAMEEYLHHLIHEEKSKVACGGRDEVLDSLKNQLQDYKHQVNNSFLNNQLQQ
jgi:hypothetical protein